MSTLTRTNSHNTRKNQYKDYVSFLGSYTKKDDQKSVSHSDSGVNFSLNGSSNNSSSSVFSDISDSSSRTVSRGKEPKPIVKTEVFIEIKDPAEAQTYPTQTFQIKKVKTPEESTISVSDAFKIFEKKEEVDHHKIVPSTLKKNSIEKLSKRFESNTVTDCGKPPARRAQSIGEVSKIFENNTQQNNTLHRPKNFNAVPRPFTSKISMETKMVPKPAILSPKPVMIAPTFKFNPDPPASYADSVDSALSSLSMSPSPPQCASPPPELTIGPMSPPPPPPPLPPSNFAIKSSSPTQQSYIPSPPKLPTQQPQSVSKLPNQPIPVQSNGSSTIDRNDPRVKKAVYGALRSMYGNYHDQANDYLSTLPKNRVRKDNRLDGIIDSIASQGGLGKLNGRVNPKPEAE